MLRPETHPPVERNGFYRPAANVLNNIGSIYDNTGKYDEALKYYQKALNLRLPLNDFVGIASSYANIGNIYRQKKDFKKSIEALRKSVGFIERTDNLEYKMGVIGGLQLTFEYAGNADSALKYYKKWLGIRDLLYNQDKEREMGVWRRKPNTNAANQLKGLRMKNSNCSRKPNCKGKGCLGILLSQVSS